MSKSQVNAALNKVEQTYLIRLFSEFEAMLKAYALINKAAKRQRANVPDNKRDAVHLVREYRNVVVHAQGGGTAAVSFRQALSALNQYLVFLPDP